MITVYIIFSLSKFRLCDSGFSVGPLEPVDDLVVVLLHPDNVGLGLLDRVLGGPFGRPELSELFAVKAFQLGELKLLVEVGGDG